MPRPDRRRVVVAVVCCALAAVSGGCGGEPVPLRVGVLVECAGFLANTRDLALAAASLPLVERGGTPAAHGGVDGARVAGWGIEVVPACTEVTGLPSLVDAVRLLVEEQHVDAVIGPYGTVEGAVMRKLAAHYPDVTFLVGPGHARDTTLGDPQSNMFRFGPDGAQSVAGLGTYAYRDLGWRSAVVVAEDWGDGWEAASGFVTEFCALGGGIVERDYTALLAPDPTAAATRHADAADGVVLLGSFYNPLPYLQALAAAQPRLDRHLVLGGEAFLDPAVLATDGVDPTGVVAASPIPLLPASGDVARFEARLTEAYPGLSTASFLGLALSNYVSMSAFVAALEAADGDLGAHQATLREGLASLTLATPTGLIRLDANRQAIVRGYLDRIVLSPAGPAGERLRSIDGVDQTYGGAITAAAPQPNRDEPVCRRATPPAWAG